MTLLVAACAAKCASAAASAFGDKCEPQANAVIFFCDEGAARAEAARAKMVIMGAIILADREVISRLLVRML